MGTLQHFCGNQTENVISHIETFVKIFGRTTYYKKVCTNLLAFETESVLYGIKEVIGKYFDYIMPLLTDTETVLLYAAALCAYIEIVSFE